jgi:hypothetical protein
VKMLAVPWLDLIWIVVISVLLLYCLIDVIELVILWFSGNVGLYFWRLCTCCLCVVALVIPIFVIHSILNLIRTFLLHRAVYNYYNKRIWYYIVFTVSFSFVLNLNISIITWSYIIRIKIYKLLKRYLLYIIWYMEAHNTLFMVPCVHKMYYYSLFFTVCENYVN